MRDTIAWSHDLLDPDERRLFRRLAPLAGDWSLAAAEALSVEVGSGTSFGHPGRDEPATLDLLAGLVEQSLVVAETGGAGDEARYRLLEPIRQYAHERLVEAGEAEAARERHAAYFLSVAEQAWPGLLYTDQGRWLDVLDAEEDNLRIALDWLLARGRSEELARFGRALYRFWWIRGHYSEGRRWRAGLLARPAELSGLTWARTLLIAAWLAYAEGDHAAAGILVEEALPIAPETDAPRLRAMLLQVRGLAALGRGDPSLAAAYLAQALALAETIGDREIIGKTLNGLGYVALVERDLERAEHLLSRAEPSLRETGAIWDLGVNLSRQATIADWQEDYARAAALARASLLHLIPLRDTWVIAHALVLQAGAAVADGQAERAARLLGAAEALREATGATIVFAIDRTLHDRHVAAARAGMSAEGFAAAWATGRTLPLEQALAEAMREPE